MAQRKHSAEWMLARVKEYLEGKGSYRSIATENGIGRKKLEDWVRKYREQGEISFYKSMGNAHYTKEFKLQCVEKVLSRNLRSGMKMNMSYNCSMFRRRKINTMFNAYTKDIARRDELKLIFKRLLEKNALGILSDVEYNEFMTSYISERDSVDQRIAEYEASKAKSENTQDRAAEFAAYLFKPM